MMSSNTDPSLSPRNSLLRQDNATGWLCRRWVGSAGDKVMEQNYILLQLKDPERADCTYRALPPAQCRLSIEPLSCRGLGVFLMTQVFPAITNPSPLNPEIQVPASEFRITIFCILSQKENHYQLSNSTATALLQALLYAAGEMHFQYP